jgi:hypothetical protein
MRSALVRRVGRLSPEATLIVFVVPFILLLPLKFLEVWLIVHRQWIGALIVLVLAKLVGLGVTAFIFEVTKDKLLQMAWFRQVYKFGAMPAPARLGRISGAASAPYWRAVDQGNPPTARSHKGRPAGRNRVYRATPWPLWIQ